LILALGVLPPSGAPAQEPCLDRDADGFSDAACGGADCNDTNPTVYPGALETCGDGIDQNCDGQDLQCNCPDLDDDGYFAWACGGDDCDDRSDLVHPGAQELCEDDIDQDCDGRDSRCPCSDRDGDGSEDADCGGDDCDDSDPMVNPSVKEGCADGIDNDCDGKTDQEDPDCPGPDSAFTCRTIGGLSTPWALAVLAALGLLRRPGAGRRRQDRS
jgi:hypothetical protein